MLYSFLSLDLIMLILELHNFLSSDGRLRNHLLPDVIVIKCSSSSEQQAAIISFAHVQSSETEFFKISFKSQITT